jgi:glycosyltransferase involved in cell wall biosynthesis
MGAGRVIFYLDNLPNREVVGQAGVPFTFTKGRTLADVLTAHLARPGEVASLGEAARERAVLRYRWDDVAAVYERLLEGLCCANPRA